MLYFLGAIAFISVVIAVGIIGRGIVLTYLWAWFIIPLFHLPVLTLPFAIGLSLIVSYMTLHKIDDNNSKLFLEKPFTYAFYLMFYPALVLLIGWIVTLFM